MADFKPDQELEAQEFEQNTRSRYVEIYHNPIARVVAAVIIVILLILAARVIHHEWKEHHATKPTRPSISTSNTSAKSNNSSTSTSTTSSNSNTGQQATSTSQMPNTGPGDVVAIFLAASFAAYLLHLAVSTRRATN